MIPCAMGYLMPPKGNAEAVATCWRVFPVAWGFSVCSMMQESAWLSVHVFD